MSAKNQPPCELLPWDTDFFGFRVARFTAAHLTRPSLAEVTDWCRDQRIDCLYCLLDGQDRASARRAEEAGFHLMDLRFEMVCTVSPDTPRFAKTEGITVREATAIDIPELKAMTTGIYQQSRFYADPWIPNERCTALYDTWVQKSCEGYADHVLVASREDHPVGYVALNLLPEDHAASIGLLGVRSTARRQGVGRLLLSEAVGWAARQNRSVLSVVTQGQNISAVQLYEKAGFSLASVSLWYHWWPQREQG
ncbi:MAG: GNAT family N-acetyltransferase [Lentisphaerae bacterium]|nr:GNAT family N-acetyltransferase [Lentisphaerota bacterium]